MNEIDALLGLSSVPYLGSIKIRCLIKQFGSAAAALEVPLAHLENIPGFGPKILSGIEKMKNTQPWKTEMEWIDKMGVHLIPWMSPDYPKRLLEIEDYPVLLYVRGELKRSDSQSIAVIGTRHPTLYGLDMAEKFGYELAACQLTVVSGLARGIDTAAHRGALKSGRTIAVIGSGLAAIYPSENRELADEIARSGALVSEFPMQMPPERQNFPQRNRIVSGMCLGSLLIEAPLKSGAMLTMEKSKVYRRKLYVLPGRVDMEQFRGNHALIKNGAQLIENVQDITESLGTFFSTLNPLPRTSVPVVDKEEAELLSIFHSQEMNLEEISHFSGISVAKLNVLLMRLVIKKAIREYPGKIYKKVSL